MGASKVKLLKKQLEYIKFQRSFDEEYQDLSPQVVKVSDAAETLKNSQQFQEFIALILFCGNYMNSGGNKAQAYGFDITFLKRLKDTKTADGEMTFLHFLAQL